MKKVDPRNHPPKRIIPILPRTVLNFVTAFTLVAFLLIIFFPTLSYTKSVYRPNEDVPAVITDAFPESTVYLNVQQPGNDYVYADKAQDAVRHTIQPPSRSAVLGVMRSASQVVLSGILLFGRLLSFLLYPLQIITVFIFQKLLFLLQPFIILATVIYTFTILWPFQLANYLAKTFYPLYVFLACAAIIGLVVGGIASIISSFLNDTIFPRTSIPTVQPTPKLIKRSADSVPESMVSSGSATPASYIRVPLPSSKYASGGVDNVRILDTNALFNSFSLPIPPQTPPGILHSAPTPAGSVSGVVGETIFEEDDDSDDKTPVASVERWSFVLGKPSTTAESTHARSIEHGEEGKSTWPGKVKREDVDVQGVDWGIEKVRRREKGKGNAV
jgi:hypothetical protein